MRLEDLAAFLFPMRTHLMGELKQQREDFQERLREKDAEIRRLRAELGSKGVRMEAPVIPQRPIVVHDGKYAYDDNAPLDWQGELDQMLKEEEDGIRVGGRVQEHQPSADDGAQAQHGA
jgi:hypothetical protein